jgi:hypothetical protein
MLLVLWRTRAKLLGDCIDSIIMMKFTTKFLIDVLLIETMFDSITCEFQFLID